MRYKTLRELKKGLAAGNPEYGIKPATFSTLEVPPQSKHLTDPNPCVREFGLAKAERVRYTNLYNEERFHIVHRCCGQCKHLQRDALHEQAKERGRPTRVWLHLCPFRVETSLPHIDHKLDWSACARFEKVEEDK